MSDSDNGVALAPAAKVRKKRAKKDPVFDVPKELRDTVNERNKASNEESNKRAEMERKAARAAVDAAAPRIKEIVTESEAKAINDSLRSWPSGENEPEAIAKIEKENPSRKPRAPKKPKPKRGEFGAFREEVIRAVIAPKIAHTALNGPFRNRAMFLRKFNGDHGCSVGSAIFSQWCAIVGISAEPRLHFAGIAPVAVHSQPGAAVPDQCVPAIPAAERTMFDPAETLPFAGAPVARRVVLTQQAAPAPEEPDTGWDVPGVTTPPRANIGDEVNDLIDTGNGVAKLNPQCVDVLPGGVTAPTLQ